MGHGLPSDAARRTSAAPSKTVWAIGSMEWLAEQEKGGLNRDRSHLGL